MSKKQSMNFFEKHLEKLCLGAAVAVFLFVFVTQVIMSGDGEQSSASDMVKQARERVGDTLRELNRPTGKVSAPYKPLAGNFGEIPALAVAEVDRVPLSPALVEEVGIESEYQYRLPEILPLADTQVAFERTLAWVAVEEEGSAPAGDRRGGSSEEQAVGVDFVTVEAKFALGALKEQFEQSFGRGDSADSLVRYVEPIVASVELERQQLLSDGSWGQWELAPRQEYYGVGGRLPTVEDIRQASQAHFEVMLQDQEDPLRQIRVLQPEPYEMVEGQWLPPTKQAEKEREEKKVGVGAATAARDRRGSAPGGLDGRGGVMPPGFNGPEGLEPGRGGQVRAGSGRSRRGGSSGGVQREPGLLESAEVALWAHDASVKPGEVYRYRVRIGFFNPIAGRNWFVPDQRHMVDERIAWSEWALAEQSVKVPERIVFFPKPAGGLAQDSAVLSVYRWDNGLWYDRTFRVAVGSPIGKLSKPSVDVRGGAAAASSSDRDGTGQEKIDFRTGAVLVDVIPDSRHWYTVGSSLKEKLTTDIIYVDAGGKLCRLGVDYNCWPQELKDKQSALRRAVSKQQRAEQETRGSGRAPGANVGGGRGGLGLEPPIR